jgi:hypothetical protein
MSDDQVKIKKESGPGMTCGSDGSHYPYGTSLNLENDMVDALEVGNLAIGDVVEVRGFAFVDSKYTSSDKDGTDKSVRLQMTSMKLVREEDDRVTKLYGN